MTQRRHAVPSWLPNTISIGRVILVPVWLIVARQVRALHLAEEPAPDILLPGLLLVLGLSDVLDGYVARRFGLTSRFGELLDAAADKLAQWAFVSYLAVFGPPVWSSIPPVLAALVVGRDLLLGVGYLVLRARGMRVDTTHEFHGKISSVVLFLLVLATVLHVPPPISRALLGISALCIVWSTASYLASGIRQLVHAGSSSEPT